MSFRHARNHYSVTVPHDSDWFQLPVLGLVNDALEASGAVQRFILLPCDGQIAFLAFVPREIYMSAVAKKLIPPSTEDE